MVNERDERPIEVGDRFEWRGMDGCFWLNGKAYAALEKTQTDAWMVESERGPRRWDLPLGEPRVWRRLPREGKPVSKGPPADLWQAADRVATSYSNAQQAAQTLEAGPIVVTITTGASRSLTWADLGVDPAEAFAPKFEHDYTDHYAVIVGRWTGTKEVERACRRCGQMQSTEPPGSTCPGDKPWRQEQEEHQAGLAGALYRKRPRPPEELVDALQDRIHPTSGRLLAAKPVETTRPAPPPRMSSLPGRYDSGALVGGVLFGRGAHPRGGRR